MNKPAPPKYVVHDCHNDETFIADDMKELKEWISEEGLFACNIENLQVFEIGRQMEVSKKLIIK